MTYNVSSGTLSLYTTTTSGRMYHFSAAETTDRGNDRAPLPCVSYGAVLYNDIFANFLFLPLT